jgi:MinD-like ATPase involved in chromosome partitioning or flagellar assembly
VLVCFWSPKGGSGTSVVAAAAAIVLAREGPARLADLAGDMPAVLGLATDPEPGLRDWLRIGPEAPTDALDRFAVDAGDGLALLPAGSGDLASATPEAGAALAVALRADPRPTVVDVGVLNAYSDAALHAFVEVADASVIVVRGCYLALRRAVRTELTASASGAVFVDEAGRSLGVRDVTNVLGVPILATVGLRASTARAVDAGVLPTRLPDSLARPAREVLRRIGFLEREEAA